MAATAINTSTFYRFTRLAPELRNQIWRATFQDEAGPVLYFYKKGSWCPRPLLPSDPGYGYDPENDESTLVFKFYHDVLDSVQAEMPLFLVNREARDVAQSWMGEHGIKIRVYRGIDGQLQPPVFVRPFDLVHDALYIAPDKWDEFLCEPDNRCFQPDMMEKYIQVYAADITRIAIPEALFRGGGDLATALPELMDRYFGQLRVLFIIVNMPSDLRPRNDSLKMQPRWELKNIELEAFIWNHDRGRFDFNGSKDIFDEALYELIEETSKRLREELVKSSICNFEIRAVSVVRT